ncbi:MAG: hypothetical protein AMXMBFR82_22020 [Candidatus Hydrogenedentota bacterium]
MREAVAAMLAADLDLPVPEPYLVMVEPEFAATIPDREVKDLAQASIGWNFGSAKLPPGFSTMPCDRPLARDLLQTAGEILAFDTFICNDDRRVTNPNLLSNGREFAIFDHELAFFMRLRLDWKSPWEPGAIQFNLAGPTDSRHVFLDQLARHSVNLDRLSGAIEAITSERLAEYKSVLPDEWLNDGAEIDSILDYIGQLRDRFPEAVREFTRAITEVKGALP